jgi:hypothetical protein
MLGEDGESRSVTWNDNSNGVTGSVLAFPGGECGFEMISGFDPGQNFFTNHLEWTLTKLGEE